MNPLILLGLAISGVGFLIGKKPENKKDVDTPAKIVPNRKPKPEPETLPTSESDLINKVESNEQETDNDNNSD